MKTFKAVAEALHVEPYDKAMCHNLKMVLNKLISDCKEHPDKVGLFTNEEVTKYINSFMGDFDDVY